jgi:hypothetical protein
MRNYEQDSLLVGDEPFAAGAAQYLPQPAYSDAKQSDHQHRAQPFYFRVVYRNVDFKLQVVYRLHKRSSVTSCNFKLCIISVHN